MAMIRGTPWADTQAGTDSNDTFLGARTDDTFYGRYGDDRIEGKRGNDLLVGSGGVDLIFGGRGNDTLGDGEGYGNRLEGGTGNDTLGSGMLNGSWSELVGGRGADTFDVGIDEYDTLLESGLRGWTDIRDFRAGEGDKIQLGLYLSPEQGNLNSTETCNFFDSNADGRLTDADDAVMWDGRALQISSQTATIVLWGLDHISSDMLIG